MTWVAIFQNMCYTVSVVFHRCKFSRQPTAVRQFQKTANDASHQKHYKYQGKVSVMKNRSIRFLSAFLLITALLSSLPCRIFAEPYTIDGYEIPVEIIINNAKILTAANAYLDGNTVYVPLRSATEALGADVMWDETARTATVTLGEQIAAFSESSETNESAEAIEYAEALAENETDPSSAVIRNNLLYVPIRMLSEILGLSVLWDSNYYQVHISAPELLVKEECLDTDFLNSDILLIAQVLQCECGSAPFEGKIAVANVILNRVASDLFPSTVTDVIYDRRGGSVQFPLAYNGKIHNVPSLECILAAKCAVNDAVVAKDCLFFQANSIKDSWTNRNRTYALTSGGNAFFY